MVTGSPVYGITPGFLYDGSVAEELSGSSPTAYLLSGGLDEVFTGTDSTGAAEFLVRVHAIFQCYPRHRSTRLQRLLHLSAMLHRTPTPTRRCPHPTASIKVNHLHIIPAQQHHVHAANTDAYEYTGPVCDKPAATVTKL